MKKLIIVISLLVFLIVGVSVYFFLQRNIHTSLSEKTTIENYVNECIGLLGKEIPSANFQRMSKDAYRKINDNSSIIVMLENNLIVLSVCGVAFEHTDQAAVFIGEFYDFFEKNDWEDRSTLYDGVEIYYKNNIYAGIPPAEKRDDGLIISAVIFSKDKSLI